MIKIKYGITGNYYAFSDDLKDVEDICLKINKSKSSIYYNIKYKKWVIKIKNKKQKKLLKIIGK